MMNKYKIMFIDDNEDVRDSLSIVAAGHGLDYISFSNLDSAKEYLVESKDINFVILDARGFVYEGQQKGSEDIDFVFLAIEEIQEYAKVNSVHLPFCVYTGYADYREKLSRKNVQVFEKARDEERMFKYILQELDNSDLNYIKSKYGDVFDFIELFFNDSNKLRIVSLLKKGNSSSTERLKILDNLANIRILAEHLMDKIYEEIMCKHPDDLGPVSGRRMLKILEEINSFKRVPEYLSNGMKNLYYTCSKYGNHNPTQDDLEVYTPSRYTVESLVAILLAFIKWIREDSNLS